MPRHSLLWRNVCLLLGAMGCQGRGNLTADKGWVSQKLKNSPKARAPTAILTLPTSSFALFISLVYTVINTVITIPHTPTPTPPPPRYNNSYNELFFYSLRTRRKYGLRDRVWYTYCVTCLLYALRGGGLESKQQGQDEVWQNSRVPKTLPHGSKICL